MSGVSVEVSARKITVPCLCPCCGATADSALAVSFTRVTGERFMRETTREFDFPYCSRCVRHARAWSTAWRLAALGISFGVLAGGAVALAAGAAAGLGVIAASVALGVGAAVLRRAGARGACTPSCACPGPAVTYNGWTDEVQAFSFASTRFAAEFAEQNHRSLVNVTPHLYQLLEQRRVVRRPEPRITPWPQRAERSRVLEYVARIDGHLRRASTAGEHQAVSRERR